jgi:diguanylate cyclase (GGDEF)-like protein
MIDIDHFKKVNDTLGHKRGDHYLIQVVGALRSVLIQIPDTLVARYGGEEFAVLLPKIGQDRAVALAEEMRASVRNMAISLQDSLSGLGATISLGVAVMTQGPTVDPDQLVNCADQALYQAKQSGRNCVVVFDSGVPSRPSRNEALSCPLLPMGVPAT